jgi:hypothetical protein
MAKDMLQTIIYFFEQFVVILCLFLTRIVQKLMHLFVWSTHPTALLAEISMWLLVLKGKLLEFYRGSTGSHSGDNWLWKTQWTVDKQCRQLINSWHKIHYVLIMFM